MGKIKVKRIKIKETKKKISNFKEICLLNHFKEAILRKAPPMI